MKEIRKRKRCLTKYRNTDSPTKLCLSNNSSYPFLTLLEEICLLIQNNNVEDDDDDTDSIKLDRRYFTDIPSIDKTQYPFSSLLQNFIQEASLQKQTNTDKMEKDGSLFHDMNSIECQANDLSLKHEKDKENLNIFDYSYASRLKHMAYQSKKYETKDDQLFQKNNDSNASSDICNILQKTFPIREQESGDMIYSRKLQNFSKNVIQERKIPEMLQQSTRNFNINSSEFSKSAEYPHYSKATTTHIENENANKSIVTDKHLFDALMNNIHIQSMVSHNHNTEPEDMVVIKKEPTGNDFLDPEISVVENLILHHFQKHNWGT